MREEGLFRVPGSAEEVNAITTAFDSGHFFLIPFC